VKALLHLWYIPFICSSLASCVVSYGPDWGVASVGTDAQEMTANRDGFRVVGLNQSKGLQTVADTIKDMWQNYLLLKGFEFITGKYYTHEGKVVDAATTVKLEELRNARTLAEGEQALQALQLMPQ
jgi:hypothetical protein